MTALALGAGQRYGTVVRLGPEGPAASLRIPSCPLSLAPLHASPRRARGNQHGLGSLLTCWASKQFLDRQCAPGSPWQQAPSIRCTRRLHKGKGATLHPKLWHHTATRRFSFGRYTSQPKDRTHAIHTARHVAQEDKEPYMMKEWWRLEKWRRIGHRGPRPKSNSSLKIT